MQILDNLKAFLLVVAVGITVVCVMVTGILMTVKMTGKNKEGFREAFVQVAGNLTGYLVTLLAVALVALMGYIATQIAS